MAPLRSARRLVGFYRRYRWAGAPHTLALQAAVRLWKATTTPRNQR